MRILALIVLTACSQAVPPVPKHADPAASSSSAAAPSSAAPDGTAPAASSAGGSENAQRIVAAADRIDHDKKLDEGRKPVETLTFFGTAPGMHVADLGAGAGYTTELVARSVGPTGVVFAQDTPNWGGPDLDRVWTMRLARPGLENTKHAMRNWDEPLPPEAKDLDAVYFVCAYHDVCAEQGDETKLNQSVFAALKHGGAFYVIDNSAKDGTGKTDCKTLHRIDEKVVRDEVQRAGFTLASNAAFLRNSADARDWNADPGADPKTHTQDRFALKFVKP